MNSGVDARDRAVQAPAAMTASAMHGTSRICLGPGRARDVSEDFHGAYPPRCWVFAEAGVFKRYKVAVGPVNTRSHRDDVAIACSSSCQFAQLWNP